MGDKITVEEAREKLESLNLRLSEQLLDFTIETGINITNVDISPLMTHGKKTVYSYMVNAEALLPPAIYVLKGDFGER